MANKPSRRNFLKAPSFWIFLIGMAASIIAGRMVDPRFEVKAVVIEDTTGLEEAAIIEAESQLWSSKGNTLTSAPAIEKNSSSPPMVR